MGIAILKQKKEEKTKIEVPTFLKWAGGKKQLLEKFDKYFPNDIENYIEPFLGGGAVLFYVLKYKKPKKAYAFDMNKELINVFVQVRDNPKKLINFLNIFQDGHNNSKNSKTYYYQKREQYIGNVKNKSEKAALLIYLNKTCYNGLYRVNSLGHFNVPFGKYEKINIFDEKSLIKAHELLQSVTFDTVDFLKIKFPNNCTIYFDPPYYSEYNGFTNYNKLEFTRFDQLQLKDLFSKLDQYGHKLFLSNSKTNFIKSEYSEFKQHDIETRRMINCNGSARTKLKELLITNFR
tara:strand:+ start:242 stop:1114 length:873 start_codon:yes stop_codon:yes gene_type:complete